MVIFYSYVSLPEGITKTIPQSWWIFHWENRKLPMKKDQENLMDGPQAGLLSEEVCDGFVEGFRPRSEPAAKYRLVV